MQPYFRTAWTLTSVEGLRFWNSGSWRTQPNDEELFGAAMEPIILLYKPLEQFGIGSRRDDGWLDVHGNIKIFNSLEEAQGKLPVARESDPESVLAHRIDPGPWELHEA